MTGTRRGRRHRLAGAFHALCALTAWAAVGILTLVVAHLLREGVGWVDIEFLTRFPSRRPESAGIRAALAGTLWLIGLTALISVPVGVAAALYLEEFARSTRIRRVLDLNLRNLAGVPSVVYGILGLAVFVRVAGLGRSVLAGSLTLSLLILPVIIVASRESIRAVPGSIRLAAFALGGTRWQTARDHVLPAALPGILTGVILALSRAIGETAPLVTMGALTYVAFVPAGPLDSFSALPIQIFNWTSRPQEAFHHVAAAGILVLLVVLLSLNAGAVLIRHRFEKGQR